MFKVLSTLLVLNNVSAVQLKQEQALTEDEIELIEAQPPRQCCGKGGSGCTWCLEKECFGCSCEQVDAIVAEHEAEEECQRAEEAD